MVFASRAVILIATLLVCTAYLPDLVVADPSTSTWAGREEDRYQKERRNLLDRQQAAVAALNKAEQARRAATRIDDRQALPVAEKAIATARRALSRIRAGLRRNAQRLQALDRFRPADDRSIAAAASALKGKVDIRIGDRWTTLDANHLLRPGETIRTGGDGIAELLFSDGARVNLHPDTTFVLESDNGTSVYRLSLGRIGMLIDRLGNRRYAIRTPKAICGVRGTGFVLETAADGATALAVQHGEVEFGPLDETKRVVVGRNERAVLTAGGELRGPEPFRLDRAPQGEEEKTE